jgi:HEAT repeat protein
MKKQILILAALFVLALLALIPRKYHGHTSDGKLIRLGKPKVGQAYRWNFSFTTDGDNSFDAIFAVPASSSSSRQVYNTELQGLLVQSILDQNQDGVKVLYEFENLTAKVQVNGVDNEILCQRIAKAGKSPFIVSFDANGRLISLQTDSGKDADSQALATILYRLQQPYVFDSKTFTVTENDENGTYQVKLVYEAANSVLKKTNQSYESKDNSPFMLESTYEVDLALDDDGAKKIDGNQILTFKAQNQTFSKAHSNWSLERTGTMKLTADQLAVLDAKARSDALKQLIGGAEDDQEKLERLVEESRLVDLLAKVQEENFGSSENRVGKILSQLVAHIRLHPKVIPEVLNIVETADFNSPGFVYSLGALVRAGTPEVQDAFTELLRNGFNDDPKRLFRLISYIHDLKEPTHELVQEILAIANKNDGFVSEGALLAAGSLSGQLDKQHDDFGVTIMRDLLQRWSAAADVDDKVRLLNAIGNSGSKAAFPVIRQGLNKSESYLTRKAAAEALRKTQYPLAQALLIDTYINDPHDEVKLAALASMQSQTLEPSIVLSLVQDLLRSKSNDSLQIRLMRTLWVYRAQEPLITQVVTQISTRGGDSGREAITLLDTAPKIQK